VGGYAGHGHLGEGGACGAVGVNILKKESKALEPILGTGNIRLAACAMFISLKSTVTQSCISSINPFISSIRRALV
jgi:hydroxyethylthiazole kinase-like sugar kinase family protein